VTKLLIDECLSSELAFMARARPSRGLACRVDWQVRLERRNIKRVLLDDDWVLVTKNSEDFRGPREAPGTKGQFADVVLHAGLICLNGPVGMDLALQRELFAETLDELDADGDLTNQILEVTLEDSEASIQVVRYTHPHATDKTAKH